MILEVFSDLNDSMIVLPGEKVKVKPKKRHNPAGYHWGKSEMLTAYSITWGHSKCWYFHFRESLLQLCLFGSLLSVNFNWKISIRVQVLLLTFSTLG